MFKTIFKFVIETVARDALSATGQQIGAAIGNRIGRLIDPEAHEIATPAAAAPAPTDHSKDG